MNEAGIALLIILGGFGLLLVMMLTAPKPEPQSERFERGMNECMHWCVKYNAESFSFSLPQGCVCTGQLPYRTTTMTKGLTAWRFYLKKFPTASSDDACALLNLIGTCGSLQGAYTASAVDKWEKRNNKSGEWTDEDVEDWLQHVEDIAHPKFSTDYVLMQYFGVIRQKGTKDERFDPVELKDSFGYDKNVIKLFRKRDKELGIKNETTPE